MRDDVRRDLGHVMAERVVRPVVAGPPPEGRDKDIGGQPGIRHPANDESEGDDALSAHQLRPRDGEVDPDPGDQQPHVLLDQEQGPQGDQRGPQPPGLQTLERHRDQHGGERDLMEVEGGGRGDRPAQHVRHGNEIRGGGRPPPATEGPAGEQPERREREREEHGLRHEESRRAAVDPVQRGQRREDRRPVIAEDGEVRAEPVVQALDDRDPGVEVGVRPDGLIEDHEVVGRGLEGVVQDQREHGVAGRHQRGQHPHGNHVRGPVPGHLAVGMLPRGGCGAVYSH